MTYYKTITGRQTSCCHVVMSNPLCLWSWFEMIYVLCVFISTSFVRATEFGQEHSLLQPPPPLLLYKRSWAASTESVRVHGCQTTSTTHTCLTFKENTPAARHWAAATSGIACGEDSDQVNYVFDFLLYKR